MLPQTLKINNLVKTDEWQDIKVPSLLHTEELRTWMGLGYGAVHPTSRLTTKHGPKEIPAGGSREDARQGFLSVGSSGCSELSP